MILLSHFSLRLTGFEVDWYELFIGYYRPVNLAGCMLTYLDCLYLHNNISIHTLYELHEVDYKAYMGLQNSCQSLHNRANVNDRKKITIVNSAT